MLNKCLEPLTAIGCALGACATGLLDAGLAAGALVGGAGLLSRFRETSEKHGLDSEALIGKMRLAVIRAWDKVDQAGAERDAIGEADAAMEKYLADCMPTREELAATALRGANVYPAEAAALVVDRLATHNDECRALFAAPAEGTKPGIGRRFALTAVEAALRAAKDDPAYAPLLTLDLVIEVAGAVRRVARGQEEDRERDEAYQMEVLKWVREQRKGEKLSDEALRGAIVRFIAFRPNATEQEVLDAIETFEKDYRALLDRVLGIEAVDNLVASFKAAAEAALREGDIEAARAHYADAIAAATEKAAEPVRNAAALIDADAAAALVALDWPAADAGWARAQAMLAPFDLDADERVAWEAASRLQEFGANFASFGALNAAVGRWRKLRIFAAAKGDEFLEAVAAQNLGNALVTQGRRIGGQAGLALLAEATAAYRAALSVRNEAAMPAEWAATQTNLGVALWAQGERLGGEAGLLLLAEAAAAYRAVLRILDETALPALWWAAQNNLGLVLWKQGERTGGEAGLALLAEAVAVWRAALRVCTEDAMPVDWAMALSNLGNALATQGERTGGEPGLTLLAEAATVFRAALRVRTEVAMPADWATTQANLGFALQTLGARMEGEAGLAFLDEAVTAFRAALRVGSEAAMPTQWATTQDALGSALLTKGARTDGDAGPALLANAAVAFGAALRVFTEAEMPTDWAKTQNNLGAVLQVQGERTGGEAGLTLLTEARAAFRAALRIYTVDHFSHQHPLVRDNLAHVEALIAERST